MTPDPNTPVLSEAVRALPDRFLLAGWEVEARAGCLRRGARRYHLEPKVIGVLLALAARQGTVVTRDEIFDHVWAEVVVTESALNRCISDLRRILGDSARRPRLIETVPKVGYRLLVPPLPVPVPAPEAPAGGDTADAHAKPSYDPAATTSGDGSLPVLNFPGKPAAPEPPRGSRPGRTAWIVSTGLVAASLLVLVIRQVTAGGQDANDFNVRVLTNLPGPEMQGVLSPDGTRAAFASHGGDHTRVPDLFVQRLDDATPINLTQGRGGGRFPAWAPDGRTLAFLRPLQAADDTGSDGAIYTISEYGTNERLLASGGVLQWGVSWSPDGETIAYVGRESAGEPPGIFLLDVASGTRTRLTDPDGSATRDLMPVFSNDGSRIVFVRRFDAFNGDLHVVPAAGGRPVRLTSDDAQVAGFAWSSDDRRVVFSSNRSGIYQLWAVAPGGTPRLVVVPSQDPGRPSITASGTMLFEDWQFDTNVWSASPGSDRSEAAPLFPSSRWDEQPALSPDGHRVAFVSTRSGRPELWTAERSAPEPARLTFSDGETVGAPRWSPDGASIAFQRFDDDGYDLYTIAAAGGTPSRITSNPAHDVNPRWSRDGRSLYFGSDRGGDWEVWRVPAEGGTAVRVTEGGGVVGEEDPAGKTLYYAKLHEKGLYSLNLADPAAEPELIVPGLAAGDNRSWVVTHDGILFLDRTAGQVQVQRWSDSGVDTVSDSLGVVTVDRPSLSASLEGNTFVWARVDHSENDLLLIEPLPF